MNEDRLLRVQRDASETNINAINKFCLFLKLLVQTLVIHSRRRLFRTGAGIMPLLLAPEAFDILK